MNANSNIILNGMPGVGKSTVGQLLAKRLGLAFLDTDVFIQDRMRKSLQALIRKYGASGFCQLEEKHILSLNVSSHVIAPGGSVVYKERAMQHLRANGTVVYLDLSVQQLKKRLEDVHARGVVIAEGQTIEGLFSERRPLYLKYADHTIRTDNLTADQIVEFVVAKVRN